MKYLKTYENIFDFFKRDKNKIKWNKYGGSFVINKKDKPIRNFDVIYPNHSDKQYWSFTYNSGKKPFVVILKFNHEEDLQSKGEGGEYYFDSVVETENTDNDNWNVGDKYIDLTFTRGSMFDHEESGRLKLATPEQIELYDKYSEINKYNL